MTEIVICGCPFHSSIGFQQQARVLVPGLAAGWPAAVWPSSSAESAATSGIRLLGGGGSAAGPSTGRPPLLDTSRGRLVVGVSRLDAGIMLFSPKSVADAQFELPSAAAKQPSRPERDECDHENAQKLLWPARTEHLTSFLNATSGMEASKNKR